MTNDLQTMSAMLSLIGFIGGCVPFVVAFVWWIMWWKDLARPGFSLLMALLSLAGLHQVMTFLLKMLRLLLQVVMPNLFDYEDARAGFMQQHLIMAVAAGILTVIFGSLLLRAAKRRQLPATAE
jgi:hypothetical protein